MKKNDIYGVGSFGVSDYSDIKELVNSRRVNRANVHMPKMCSNKTGRQLFKFKQANGNKLYGNRAHI